MRGTVLPLLMALLGLAIVVRTVVAGGGPVAFGIVVGVLFVAAGGGRFWLERRNRG